MWRNWGIAIAMRQIHECMLGLAMFLMWCMTLFCLFPSRVYCHLILLYYSVCNHFKLIMSSTVMCGWLSYNRLSERILIINYVLCPCIGYLRKKARGCGGWRLWNWTMHRVCSQHFTEGDAKHDPQLSLGKRFASPKKTLTARARRAKTRETQSIAAHDVFYCLELE